jgi:RHS repeat-associated protein
MPTVNYLWDPISDNIVREVDENGNVIVDYTTEPGYHGAVISEHRDGQSYYPHHDGQGNTRALTDDQGNVTDTFAYTANGELTERTGTTPTPFQCGGEHGYYTDQTTGEIMVRRRDYDPPLGRWLSVDPSGFIDGINLYQYVRNNPISLVDPSGLQAELEFHNCICKCRCNTIACVDAAVAAILARLLTSVEFDEHGRRQGGPGDAYRHCMWNCIMVMYLSITEACAKCIADNHEERNRAEGSPQEHIDMDLHNNEVGRRVGRGCWSVLCCADRCVERLNVGELVTIR